MPGYGISGPEEGSGLLHWSWAAERLAMARNFLDPAKNATIGVRPRRVFSLRAGDFTGSPTRWTFED